MNCKCIICGKILEISKAFCWNSNDGRTFYFCSEKEGRTYAQKRKLDKCIERIFNFEHEPVILSDAKNEWSKINYSVDAINNHANWIIDILDKKGKNSFTSEYNLAKYLITVINSNLNYWIKEVIQINKRDEYINNKIDNNHSEFKAKSFRKRKMKCLDDYEDEGE